MVTMIEHELILYSNAVARVIRVRGERQREKVIAMLCALDLTVPQADEVIRYGLGRNLFTEDTTGAMLRARPPALLDHIGGAPGAAGAEDQATILRTIEENLPVVVWAADGQGIFIHHAGKALTPAGLTQGHFLGMNILEIYAGTEGMEPMRQAFAGNLVHSFTEAHGLAWENWQIPVRDAQGEVASVIGISLDISDAKRVERALKDRVELIERQQQVIRALSTPILEVWDKVLTLPLLGVLDSARAAEVMESLLSRIVRTRARFAILDLTGVEAVDTGTASHLLKLIQAVRLVGADGVITGIQPSVAQTMVSLGLDLGKIATLANLREGLQLCMARMREHPSG